MLPKKSPNPIDKHVGSRVRMRRMMLHMSQENLGDRLNLTFQQVQKYEKGINLIGASRLQQISQILQVPVGFFFEGAPAATGLPNSNIAPSPEFITAFMMTREGLVIAKAWPRLEAGVRHHIVKLVEEIAEIADAEEATEPKLRVVGIRVTP
jgi:transcriptional regulator with XRE-family HTH domain